MIYTDEMKVTGNSSRISCKVAVEADGVTCNETNATEGDQKLNHAICDINIPANTKINLPIRIDGAHSGGRIDLYIDGILVNVLSLTHSPASLKQNRAFDCGYSTITREHQNRLLECDLIAKPGKSDTAINDSAKTESDELEGTAKQSSDQATTGTLHMRVYLSREETKLSHIPDLNPPLEKDDNQACIVLVPREAALTMIAATKKRNLMNAKDAPGKAAWCDFTWKYTITQAAENSKVAEGAKSKRHSRKMNSEAIDSARATPLSDTSAIPSAPATPADKVATEGGQGIATKSEDLVKNEDLESAQTENHDAAKATTKNEDPSSVKTNDQGITTDTTSTDAQGIDASQADNQAVVSTESGNPGLVPTNIDHKDPGTVQSNKRKLPNSEMPPPKRTRLDVREEESVRAKAQAEQKLMEKQNRLASLKAKRDKQNAEQMRRIETNFADCRELEEKAAGVDQELEELEAEMMSDDEIETAE